LGGCSPAYRGFHLMQESYVNESVRPNRVNALKCFLLGNRGCPGEPETPEGRSLDSDLTQAAVELSYVIKTKAPTYSYAWQEEHPTVFHPLC
jgi:hypothetical protein